MATVYLAQDLKHQRYVAIKALKPEFSAVVGPERFLREIELTARLNHPHILPLLDSGKAEEDLLYYAMPYAEGESLRQWLNREKQLSVHDALQIACEVADALGYAHRHDVVHRDIKPENILLQEHHALVADFGIGKVLAGAANSDPLTQGGMTIGTPAYMSPEQAAAENEIDGRSDLYSLGCVLYEMLTGEPPFSGPNVQSVMVKRIGWTPPHVHLLRNEVPQHVSGAVEKLLARGRADRFATGEEVVAALQARDGSAVSVAEPVARSVAVLPFENIGADPENEYFSDGVAEEIMNALTRLPGLRVAARSSAFSFKGKNEELRVIGNKLHVNTVLQGSVRRVGSRVRVTAQLVNILDGYALWSQRFDRELTDVFVVQDEIAHAVAERLQVTVAGGENETLVRRHTANVQAYELYLKGRSFALQRIARSFETALGYFDRALQLDPYYALAHSGRADVLSMMGIFGMVPPTAAMEKARNAASLAQRLDDGLAETHATQALVHCMYDWDWPGAEREFRRAIELSPTDTQARSWYALFYLTFVAGDMATAVREVLTAVEMDPLSGYAAGMLSHVYWSAGESAEALRWAGLAVEREPNSYFAQHTLNCAARSLSDWSVAFEAAERAVLLSGRSGRSMADLAITLAAAGRVAEAEGVYKDMLTGRETQRVGPVFAALTCGALRRLDEAFGWLDQAYEDRDPALVLMKKWPPFATLKGDPRYDDLLRRVGFP